MGFAAAQKEDVKLTKNGPNCNELGWECIPLAVETYDGWGEKAHETLMCSSRRLAVGSASRWRLSLTLMRENARAILARSNWPGSLVS